MLLAILGRQPQLGLAELESLYGARAVQRVGLQACMVATDHIDHRTLGGTIRVARPLAEFPTNRWDTLHNYFLRDLPRRLTDLPEGKIKLGISVFDIEVTTQQLLRTGLELKKACRQAGRSLRVVPSGGPELNSAAVLHNQLTGELGIELLCIRDGRRTRLAQTMSVQDIDVYAARDHGRPFRDAYVGMLPPKLAQIMLNLAGVNSGMRVLDPFCGTGVVLQEAALRGCAVYGTDLNERMVRFTRDNLAWLQDRQGLKIDKFYEVADATNAIWQQPVDNVVCETYLGKPLTALPAPAELQKIVADCNTITKKFLQNVRPQLQPGSRHCFAVPAWRTPKGMMRLPVLDDLNKLGYNRLRFTTVSDADLVYHREDQIVARQLLVVTII